MYKTARPTIFKFSTYRVTFFIDMILNVNKTERKTSVVFGRAGVK